MKRQPGLLVLLFVGALASPSPVVAASRNLAIVVDTSGSMENADRPRYTMQLSQILSDLVDTGDELSVIRMQQGLFATCFSGVSPSLVLRLNPSDRASFKQRLDQVITFNTGTWFAAPIRTAISILQPRNDAQRMLLIIADSGGLGMCEGMLTQEMLALKRTGVTIAAINIGSNAGAFDSNPAFDFTTAALDSQGLIEAVALVYQRFLGAKKVQTGRVRGEISVEIAPYVDEAFLVVAADGPIAAIEQLSGNPGAASIDLNHRGGGSTLGLDNVLRGYRIVRLERPAPGRWRFQGTGIRDTAGWMLLQDSAVGVRLVSSPTIPRGAATALEVELFDQRTGARIADSSRMPGLQTELEIGGRKVAFRDDGTGGDRKAGDGILTATTTFDRTGDQPLSVHLQSDFLDRRVELNAKVIDAAWRVEVKTPPKVEVDQPVPLTGVVQPVGTEKGLPPPDRIDVKTGDEVVELRDDGQKGDQKAGDRTYARNWTPPRAGNFQFEYKPEGGGPSITTTAPIQVVGRLRFGPSVPIRLGRLQSNSVGNGHLDLSSADVRGEFTIRVSTEFDKDRSVLEIDPGTGWVKLGREPLTLQLRETGARTWPVRLRVGECPEGHAATRPFDIAISATSPNGSPVNTKVPVTVEIVPDSWLHCWWPVLALALGAIAIAVGIHGYWSPSRFSPRLGVVLSPEEDIAEGFFHPIRAERGSSSGFYRDARIFVCGDFRLSGRPRNAVARLRADGKQVRIAPADGAVVWRRTADGQWEQILPDESPVRFGDLYRNDPGSLYFELRNA